MKAGTHKNTHTRNPLTNYKYTLFDTATWSYATAAPTSYVQTQRLTDRNPPAKSTHPACGMRLRMPSMPKSEPIANSTPAQQQH